MRREIKGEIKGEVEISEVDQVTGQTTASKQVLLASLRVSASCCARHPSHTHTHTHTHSPALFSVLPATR